MEELKQALIIRKKYNRMDFDEFIPLLEKYLNKEFTQKEKDIFKLSGLLNTDIFIFETEFDSNRLKHEVIDKGYRYLHNHPMTEKKIGLNNKHVIVDRDAWKYARKQGLNLPIRHDSRRELFDNFYKWLDNISEAEYDDMSLTDKCEKYFFEINKIKEMTNNELLKEFDLLTNDVDRWKWIKEHQHTGIIIYLDNDDTCGMLPDPDDEDDVLTFQFEDCIGWDEGVLNLLKAYGIKAECV